MKNDDEINESSISDLIHYAEDEKRNTFDDEPETDDELDDEITETDDETVSDKEEPVSEEVSEETKKTEEEPVSEEADEEPEDELALEEADEENSSEEEKTLSNNVNYDDDIDYPDYEFHCTLSTARRRIKGLPSYQLHTVAAYVGYELEQHHHALADAEACAWIAREIIE